MSLSLVTHAVIFDCEYRNAAWPSIGNRLYTCLVTVINSERRNFLENAGGDHLLNETNLGVRGLEVADQLLNEIPENVDNFFQNIKAIQLSHTGLKAISANDLKQFPHLTVLSITKNKLKALNGDVFKHTMNLKWISFFDNLIENVGVGLLTSLKDLEFADFRNNPCVNFRATSTDELRALKIHLVDCSTPEATLQSPTVQHMDCTSGKIESLENKIIKQSEIISQLHEDNEKFEKRIDELEKRMKTLERS